MEALVLITTIHPELIAWVAAISFFVSIAVTAIVSRGRKWFELAVILGIGFMINLVLVGLIVQLVLGIELIHVDAIGTIQTQFRE